MLENIHVLKFILQNNFEIISGKFPGAEIKLFQTDVDKGRNNFISHVTMALHMQLNSSQKQCQQYHLYL